MSLGYAQKLSYKEDLGGSFGKPELVEPGPEVRRKALLLADLIKSVERVVVFTGAGISTSAGIPDFRGPQGVWTLQKQGLPFEAPANAFAIAKPSLTHLALVALRKCGKLGYVVSQNVDNLHLQSGIDAAGLAELHGNCFIEQCHSCRAKYRRAFEIETVGFKPTGRQCTMKGCRGRLRDMVLDWDDALPEDDLKASEQHASNAQLALCLGTSLQVRPANSLPLRTVKAGGKLAIVNLQKTCKDRQAHIVVNAKCDDVMRMVIGALDLQLPVWKRVDTYVVECILSHSHKQTLAKLSLLASDGLQCPLPMLRQVSLSIQGPKGNATVPEDDIILRGQPWQVTFPAPLGHHTLEFAFTFQCAADDNLRVQQRQLSVDFGTDKAANDPINKLLHTELQFTTQIHDYNCDVPSKHELEASSNDGSSTSRASKRLKR